MKQYPVYTVGEIVLRVNGKGEPLGLVRILRVTTCNDGYQYMDVTENLLTGSINEYPRLVGSDNVRKIEKNVSNH